MKSAMLFQKPHVILFVNVTGYTELGAILKKPSQGNILGFPLRNSRHPLTHTVYMLLQM